MADTNSTGRHRSIVRAPHTTAVRGLMGRSVGPVGKTSAVLAASGGLLAALAVPAASGAAPAGNSSAALIQRSSAAQPAALLAPGETSQNTAAVAAPTTDADVTAPAAGSLGFTAVAKPAVLTREPADPDTAEPDATGDRVPTTTPDTDGSTTEEVKAPTKVPAPASAGILGVAASLTGIYYIYGGSTPRGFDCSGYTSYVFRKVGKHLPRTAEAQRRAATRVSKPQPGDLVFFGIPAHHVGIYAGGGMMYDSPRTGYKSSLRKVHSGRVTYGRP